MEKIEIRNFGPIKEAEIEIKDINVFIGKTSSGKSTAAKLIAIFKDIEFYLNDYYTNFNKRLADYNIDFDITNNTYINYFSDEHKVNWEIKNMNLQRHHKPIEKPSPADYIVPNINYIPAERAFFPMIAASIFGLLKNDVALAKCIKNFGSEFEEARMSLKKLFIGFLNVKYEFSDGNNYLIYKNVRIRLEQASSGFQSVVPLIVVVEYFTEKTKEPWRINFIIEEPELNLYPTVQKKLVEYLIERINGSKNLIYNSYNKLFITTHSPYILTSLDNLIQAHNVAMKGGTYEEEAKKIVDPKCWLEFERVSCYYFKEDGTCKSTLDHEYRLIGASEIDDVSTEISNTYENLIDLKYKE